MESRGSKNLNYFLVNEIMKKGLMIIDGVKVSKYGKSPLNIEMRYGELVQVR